MPLYDFLCPNCGEFEIFLRLREHQSEIRCPDCDATSKQIMVPGHGASLCDSINDVSWLPSAVENLPDDAKRKVQGRRDHQRYLKEKGLIATG